MQKKELKAKIAELEEKLAAKVMIEWDLDKNQPMVDTMQDEINVLTAENKKLEDSLKKGQARRVEMALKIDTLEVTNRQLSYRNQELVESLKRGKASEKQMTEEIRELRETVKKLTDERDLRNLREKLIVGGNEREIRELKEELRGKSEKIAELEGENSELREFASKMKTERNSLGWVLKEKSEKIAKLEAYTERLTAMNSDQAERILSLRGFIKEWERTSKEQNERIESLRKSLQAEEKKVKELESCVSTPAPEETTCTDCTGKGIALAALRKSLKDSEARCHELEEVNRELRDRNLERANRELMERLDNLSTFLFTGENEATTCKDCESKEFGLKSLREELSERNRFFTSVSKLVDDVRWGK